MWVQTPTPSGTERSVRLAGAGGDTGSADPFQDELVSLLVMTANGQADGRSPCATTR
jgi:hypothetical protein